MYVKKYIEQIPIVNITNAEAKGAATQIIGDVNKIIGLKNRIKEFKTDYDRNIATRQVINLEEDINQTIYGLYGLNDRDIATIEESSKSN
jgi:hypothetical protein